MNSQRYDHYLKGLPSGLDRSHMSKIDARSLKLLDDDLALPAALLKQSALQNNRRWMREFLQKTGVRIAPHGKTTLSPQLFAQQLEDGAWGITAATAHHARLYAAYGVKRILMANQLVGEANINLVLDLLGADPDLDFYCLVDSAEGVAVLADTIRRNDYSGRLQVLIELGAEGARSGARSFEKVLETAEACRENADQIALRGLEIFEGVFQPGPSSYPQVGDLHQRMATTAGRLDDDEFFAAGDIVLTAGGSVFFDMSAELLTGLSLSQPIVPVIRSGCYITHDSKHYVAAFNHIVERKPELKSIGRLRGALEVWAHIQSIPEPGMVIASLGKRDISFDVHMPTPLSVFRKGEDKAPRAFPGNAQVKSLYDQHAVIDIDPGHDLKIGDLAAFGLSHPCTTFDKWRTVFVVDDAYRVVDSIDTYF